MGGLDDAEEMSDEGGEDADDMDLSGLDLGEGDDELASMMEAMDGAEPTDMEASDRMYEAEEGMEEESEEDAAMPPAAGGEEEEMAEEGSEEELSMDDDSDMEGMDLLPNLEVSGPLGGMKFSNADKAKMAALAKKLAAKGEKGLAARVAKLAKK
jgi:hypothetical protein